MLDRIHYISQGNTVEDHFTCIQKVLDAGGRLIQLRYKNKHEIYPLAEKVKLLCENYEATLIINDFVDVAKEVDADGLHLGLNDATVENARTILGNDKIIGGTANTLKDVQQRIDEKCTYIGLGPFRYTTTKEKLSPILGLESYQSILSEVKNTIPIYAIGGIHTSDVKAILKTGIYGIALSGLITQSDDKKELIKELNTIIHGSIKNS